MTGSVNSGLGWIIYLYNAPSEAALQSLAAKLQSEGLETKGVETYHTGNRYVAFRDPDNIQLEYWLPK